MGMFRRVLTPPSERATVQTIDIRDPEIWRKVAWPDKMDTATGITVSPESSMRSTAVYNAVTIIAGTVGSLPLPVYQRLDNEGRERAPDHPLYSLLHDEPNSVMTSMTFWEMALVHLLHHGNFYAEKERDPLNEVRALWPLPANRVEPKPLGDDLKNGLYYEITKKNGQTYPMMSRDIFHIPGLGFDGIKGYSVIKMAKEAVGLGLAAEAFGERFYKNNMRPGIVLKLSGKFEDLSDQALKNLKQSFQEQHGGAENAHKPLFLEEGMDFASYSIAPEDAQFLELRKFQVVEVARMFNLPPHKLGDLDRATFSNIEQQELNFVIGTIRPWLVRIEQLIRARLFSTADQGTYYAEFLVDALLRGDSVARAAFYHSMRMDGLMNANEVRARENLNPIPGGDKYYMPVNMMPTDALPTTPAPPAVASVREVRSSRSGIARRQVRDSYKRVFREGTQRVVRGERRNVMKILKAHKDPDELKAHLEEFYRGPQQEFIVKQMAGPFFSLAEAIQPLAADQVGLERDMTPEVQAAVKIHVDKFAYREAMQSYNRLVKIVGSPLRAKKPEPDLEELFGDEFDGMEESRPDRVAEWETVRTDGMVSRTVFEASGIIALVWAANENSCDYCAEMNGRTVGIDIPFIGPDDSLSVEGADDMSPSWNCTSPPLHNGCSCSIEPGV